MNVTDVEVSRSLNAVVTTLNDRRPAAVTPQDVQPIVTGALGGEERILARPDAGGGVQLTDRDGTVLARVHRKAERWLGERVGPPLSGAYVPSA